MSRALTRFISSLIAPLRRRIAAMVGRCIIAAVDDSGGRQVAQITLRAGEAADRVEVFQCFGLTSRPMPGAEGIALAVGGERAHLVVVATGDRRSRPRDLQPGETVLYDEHGNSVELRESGIIVKSTNGDVTVEAETVTVNAGTEVIVNAPAIGLGGTGGQPVARTGDAVAGGVITGGSTVVSAI